MVPVNNDRIGGNLHYHWWWTNEGWNSLLYNKNMRITRIRQLWKNGKQFSKYTGHRLYDQVRMKPNWYMLLRMPRLVQKLQHEWRALLSRKCNILLVTRPTWASEKLNLLPCPYFKDTDLKSDTATTSVSLLARDEMIDYAFKYNAKLKSND